MKASPRVNRAEFLKSAWHPYPCAPKNCCVAGENPQTGQWVGGRLGQNHSGWVLKANGSEVQIRFAETAKWRGAAFENFDIRLLAIGDVVSVLVKELSGSPTAAEILTEEIQLLAPALHPFQLQTSFDVARSRHWAEFTARVREFFRQRDFMEAVTPTLVPSPGTEPFLDAFSTRWEIGSQAQTFYLPTSPEFHLKKMLVAGWTRVFEIRACFRNGEIGAHHQPEFTMIEWYRAYSDLDAIADDVESLLLTLGAGSLERTTMSELFAQSFSGFCLTPQTTLHDLKKLADSYATRVEVDDTWDEVFFRLFLEHIEGGLGLERPLLVRGYPPSQAALARIGPDGFADRFEVYWRGMELANAFHELNDPEQNAQRFAQDAKDKKNLGKSAVPVDQDLLRALGHGLPPSGGIALGMDRLFMALHQLQSIAETRAFPQHCP